MNGIVVTVQCHYCSKGRSPAEIITLSESGVRICHRCWQWHLQAVDALAGNPPSGCQVCHRPMRDLENRTADGNVRMQIHVKDGIYSVLCTRCSDKYVRQRRDLYRETPFAKAMNLA